MADKKEIDELWSQLDQLGLEEVRKRKAQKIYSGWKRDTLEQWLHHQQAKQNGDKAEQKPLASRIIDKLLNHPVLGVIIAMAIAIAAVTGFRKDVCELYKFPYVCGVPADADGEMASLHIHVVVEGSEKDCANAKCLYRYYIAGIYEMPDGHKAIYRDRVKASAGIVGLHTIPNHIVRNPDQYRGNKTYLEFEIHPPASSPHRLEAQAELVVFNKATAQHGKIGVHLPYKTKYASMTVELGQLPFRPSVPVEARIESLGTDGVLREGGSPPILRTWRDGAFLQVLGRDLPSKSSLVLRWGPTH